ncbi:MAG: DUF3365 domain-containing protein [Magnetovibrio sp.]|nr:DUF3365 domain-containing protein [Magnetovibrio sp.]
MPIILWAGLVLWSYVWNLNGLKANSHNLALEKGRMVFSVIEATRMWNASHGGLYAPTSDMSPSNPYLIAKEKDIVSPSGQPLTLINPAYMTRQLAAIMSLGDINIHLTSLKPINPNNMPTDWERNSLMSFENGVKENLDILPSGKEQIYAYMAPLSVKEPCMKCHAVQGYKVGDVRGGIRVSFPVTALSLAEENAVKKLKNVHLIVFVLITILSSSAIAWARYLIANLRRERNSRDDVIAERTQALQYEVGVKNRLFSIISHDLKSPFNSLLGMTHMMSNMGDQLNKKKMAEYAKDIHETGEHIFELVQNLLEWARLQMDGATIVPEKVALNNVLQNSVDVLLPLAKDKNIQIKNQTCNCQVTVDKEMIMAVVRNILANAIKFTPSGGKITLHAQSLEGDATAQITIEDTGVGIPQHIIDNIFSIDQKTTTLGTDGEAGTGLGLPLCRDMLDRNGGKIWVESAVGFGSKFHFTLPLADKPTCNTGNEI